MPHPKPKLPCIDGNRNCISYYGKYCIAENTSGSGNLSEPSPNCFFDEYSDKRPSGQYLRPNIQPIYHLNHADSSWTLDGTQNRLTNASFAGYLPGSCVFAGPRLFTMSFLVDHFMTFSSVRQRYHFRWKISTTGRRETRDCGN